MNIKNEFYSKVGQQFNQGVQIAQHLLEMGCINSYQMEQYLIRYDFKAITDKNIQEGKRKGTRAAFEFLAEKYNKSSKAIEYIIGKTPKM